MAKLLLITSDWPPRMGGVANYYYGLHHNYPEAIVLTNVIGAQGERVIKTSWTWPGWPKWLPLLWLVPYWKNKLGIKFLAAGEILPTGTALLLTRLAFGWPYLVFLHGLDIQLAQRNFWKRFLSRQILKRSAGVIANSNFTAQLAVAAGARAGSVEVIYPSVSPQTVRPEVIVDIKQRYQLENRIIILTVARLVERKGITRVIEAIAQVEEKFNNLVYVIVGDGPAKDQLAKQSSRLKSRVIFTGAILDEEKFAWYQLCSIFILTPLPDKTDVEGFGIVYLEAQAAGRAIIASRVGGVPEAVGEAGIFINSAAELAAGLQRLLSDDKAKLNLAAIGRSQSKKFRTAGQAEKFNKYIKNLNS
ncbi:MAG TPA: hypothetical protein DDW92_02370 [Candidatus Veblenbacteria bacterium]|uniref:Glycosyltransferase subfamily 4-like N-terminal domain-containing protein n=3 Tax=Candidatus Vebleniibacteriota TaxID=1817921 RepID=A0A1G2Q6D1_9BACT|nr:MAG: Glycosyltransferase, group 1 family protein [Parcubacteria group bacterium GW2011_GWA2_42_80]KKS79308.1 MAG: Glycosyltransferase, group 1 family protein [Parcubacteria group bacterium GW2011_GWD1_42_9]KKS93000.1 MAG: Glycosyltransferase, group 1 family protein [Parcubacteria group bacterium GW2011_GWE2_43_12]KKT13313.1 MAG: Glycosyltransferase, group 1 family protein [Parcubacteria group bacterium GW2011_GWA1_43_27]KKT15311.1 MAG: Glycosyltransferase, group 1 family protein [Parcubacter